LTLTNSSILTQVIMFRKRPKIW